jgi:hypothetical protein
VGRPVSGNGQGKEPPGNVPMTGPRESPRALPLGVRKPRSCCFVWEPQVGSLPTECRRGTWTLKSLLVPRAPQSTPESHRWADASSGRSTTGTYQCMQYLAACKSLHAASNNQQLLDTSKASRRTGHIQHRGIGKSGAAQTSVLGFVPSRVHVEMHAVK